jgi:chemotaxis protein histidine kinase CheA
MAMSLIPNNELTLEQIPSSEGDLRGWSRFAHTINGYEQMGGFDSCADLANSGGATTLTQLRCALFFEARRDRHSGGYSLDEDVIRRLLKAIRLKVEAGDLD